MRASQLFVFFFQAEGGIRDVAVTGVQTCALPISGERPHVGARKHYARVPRLRRDVARLAPRHGVPVAQHDRDRKSTRLNSSHGYISYAVFCLKKKKKMIYTDTTTDRDIYIHVIVT